MKKSVWVGACMCISMLSSCASAGLDDLNGEWTLQSIDRVAEGVTPGQPDAKITTRWITAETPYIGFKDGQMWGYDGCNHLSGSVKFSRKNIDFSQVASTMRYCPGNENRAAFTKGLGAARKAKVSNGQLVLQDADGRKVMTFVRRTPAPRLLSGEWNVLEMKGEDGQLMQITPSDDTPYVGFQVEVSNFSGEVATQRLYGSTGCNRLTGSLDVSQVGEGNLSFPAVGVTRMMCPDNPYEKPFLDCLNQARHVSIYQDQLQLKDAEGNVLMTLRRRI